VPQEIRRRQFLSAISGGLGCTIAGAALGANRLARGIEPIVRTGKPHFKFSLAAYSYRDLLSGDMPALTLFDFIADCARFGLDGTELTSYYFPTLTDDAFVRSLKQACFRLGLDVSGTAVGNDFCHPEGPDRQRELAHVETWIRLADILGAPVIRIFSGSAKGEAAEAHSLAVAGIQESCRIAEQAGIYLALENHGGLTETAEGMLALVQEVDSPAFGVNLDTGNFHSADLYGDLERLAPYAVNVQIKVMVSSQGGPKEPADFDRLARILTQSGYRGYIVLEYEEEPDPREACPRYLDQLRAAFSAAERG